MTRRRARPSSVWPHRHLCPCGRFPIPRRCQPSRRERHRRQPPAAKPVAAAPPAKPTAAVPPAKPRQRAACKPTQLCRPQSRLHPGAGQTSRSRAAAKPASPGAGQPTAAVPPASRLHPRRRPNQPQPRRRKASFTPAPAKPRSCAARKANFTSSAVVPSASPSRLARSAGRSAECVCPPAGRPRTRRRTRLFAEMDRRAADLMHGPVVAQSLARRQSRAGAAACPAPSAVESREGPTGTVRLKPDARSPRSQHRCPGAAGQPGHDAGVCPARAARWRARRRPTQVDPLRWTPVPSRGRGKPAPAPASRAFLPRGRTACAVPCCAVGGAMSAPAAAGRAHGSTAGWRRALARGHLTAV